MSAQALLDRLDRVRKRTADQWSARCPAHEDKGPSLSVREIPDGRVLVHCFAGCSVEEVLGAVGMTFDDLFPEKVIENAPRGRRRLITASQALEVLDFEALLVAIVASDIAKGKRITDETVRRVSLAAGRISAIRQEVQA
jgi:hypothetical protein